MCPSAPLVGILLSFDPRGRLRPGRPTQYLDARYARAVEEAGGTPTLIPILTDPLPMIERLDALLIPGGDDFLPEAPYPESVGFDPVPEEQLRCDQRSLLGAVELQLPILGICYGMQLLARHFEGRLHHDLPTDLPGAMPHQMKDEGARHAIEIEAGTTLSELLRPGRMAVNSRHHQAVAHPGDGLRVSARSRDGVIEAIESPVADFCVGVQWHPETLERPHRVALFAGLVEAARRRHRGPEALV